MANWKNKINHTKYGILAGLTFPLLGFLLRLLQGWRFVFSAFWQIFIQNHDLLQMNI